jgi:acetylornithine/succinyldiaminopimelate/putrescine aminotransferase
MIGIELRMPGKQLVLDAIDAGILINCTHDVVLRLLPPYTITEGEVDRGIKALDRVLRTGAKLYAEHRQQQAN